MLVAATPLNRRHLRQRTRWWRLVNSPERANLKEEQKQAPVMLVNNKGQLEDAEGKTIVDESGKPVAATKE